MSFKELITRSKIFALVRALEKYEQFILLGATVIFLVSGITYATLYLNKKTEIAPSRGGEFKEGIVGQPAFINPVFPTTDADRDISRLVFVSVREAADSIQRSQDGRTWNVRLKEGIYWHDGAKLTSDDIIFTLEVIQNPEARSPLYSSFQGVAAERVSELEIKFVTQSPYAFFETDHLNSLRIIPKHLFNDIPTQNLKLSSYGLHPVGAGPYQVASYETDLNGLITEVKLKANEKYFKGRPNINTFIFKFYRNVSDVIRAYNLGQIDGMGLGSAEPLGDTKVTIRHKVYPLHSFRYYAVFINPNLGPKELAKPGVRLALSAATDRDRIIREVFLDNATPLYGPTILALPPQGDFNFELLKGLNLKLVVPSEPFLIKSAQIIKENWESQGAEVSLQILPAKNIQEEILRKSEYQMILFGNITKESEDLFAFWHSSRRFYPDQNLALYKNSKVDANLETYRQSFDPEERLNLLRSISNAIAAEVPAIFLYSPQYTYIASPQLGGLDPNAVVNTADDRFANVANWYVKTRRVFKQ